MSRVGAVLLLVAVASSLATAQPRPAVRQKRRPAPAAAAAKVKSAAPAALKDAQPASGDAATPFKVRPTGARIVKGSTGAAGRESVVKRIDKPPPPPPPPEGQLDGEVLAAEVRTYTRQVKICADRAKKRLAVVTGKIVVKWEIATDGATTAVEIGENTGVDDEVAACVLTLVSRWRFSPPQGAAVKVTFPFVFQ